MAIVPIITLLLLLGMLTGANLFALGASTFLIAIQLARFLSNRWAQSITIERQQNQTEIQIGEVFPVGLQIKNTSGYWIPWLLIEDRLSKVALKLPPPALELIGRSARLQWFRPRQVSLMTYTLRGLRRGYFQIGPSIIETGDLLGLHRSYRVVSQPQYLVVLPKLIELQGMEISSRRPMGDLRVNDRGMEDPTMMVGIRQYIAGDPINRVHWKATARTGVLHTRMFQPTCMQGAMILLDLHVATNPEQHEPVRTDLAVTAAASIANMLYHMGQPFGLVTNGRDAADRMREISTENVFTDRNAATRNIDMRQKNDRIRPVVLGAQRGPEHFEELHRMLARVERTDGLRLSDLLMETQSRLPRMMSLIAIVQQIDDAGALSLAMLRRRGFAITVIVNQVDEAYMDTAARLVAHNIPTLPLHDETSIATVCRKWMMAGQL
ncbi:MAG: DUF58 domain-containing protein [Planctomycetota bacterium]